MKQKYQDNRNSREIMFHVTVNELNTIDEADWMIVDIQNILEINTYNQDMLYKLLDNYIKQHKYFIELVKKFQTRYFLKGVTKFIIYSALNEYCSIHPTPDKKLIIKEYLLLSDKYNPQASRIIHSLLDKVINSCNINNNQSI